MQVLSPAPRDLWREVLQSDPLHLVTQTPDWLDVMTDKGYRDASRAYVMDGGQKFVLPAVSRRTRVMPLSSMPPAWGFGGLVSTEPLQPSVVAAVCRDLESTPSASVRIRPNPLLAEAWGAANEFGIEIPRRAHVLDLSGGYERVWEDRMRRSARSKVRRAERLDVVVRRLPGRDGLGDFYHLFELSLRRWAKHQNEPEAMAVFRGRRRDPISKFQLMADRLGEAFRLWVAYVDAKPAAAVIVLQGKNAHYTRGAADAELSGPSQAAYLVQAAAIEDACSASCGFYHMGETGDSAGLAEFKERLGARAVPYSEYRMERIPLTRIDSAARTVVKKAIGFKDA